MRDFMPEMPKKRPVGLVHLLTDLGADGVVGFRDVERDLAVIMACQDLALSILSRRRRQEIEGDPRFRLLGLALNGKTEAQETIDEAVLRDLDTLPSAEIFRLGQIGDGPVELAGFAKGIGAGVNQPIASAMLEIRAIGYRARRFRQRCEAA